MNTSSQNIHDTLEQATARQRMAADPTASVWVSANAGTGKTRVLVDRISRLLLAGVRAEKILCLTFTKAAAAEMENRLSQRLGQWAVMDDETLHIDLLELLGRVPQTDDLLRARRLFAQTLEAPGGMKVRTIHAFCESILARFPIESAIAPHATVMDDRSKAEILASARERVYRRAFDDPASPLGMAIAAIARNSDEAGFEAVMQEMLNKRQRLSSSLHSSGGLEGLIDTIRTTLGLAPGDTPDTIRLKACHNDAFDGPALSGTVGALETGSDSDKKRARQIDDWLRASEVQRIEMLDQEYIDLFMTKAGSARAESGLITKQPREAYPAALMALHAEQARIVELGDRIKAAGVATATSYLVTIAVALFEDYEALKQQRALLDYDDLILKTLALLRRQNGVSWVHYKLDGGIDHVLVDEAQDTSPEQWQVIKLLAGDFFTSQDDRTTTQDNPDLPLLRTVFAVGDEKQSIYSFQGADPAGFALAHDHFAKLTKDAGRPWQKVTLIQSFRSTSAVLDLVDAVFEQPHAQPGVCGEDGTRHLASRKGHAGLVELWPTIAKSDYEEPGPWDAPVDRLSVNSPITLTAETIARTIDGWLKNGEILASLGRPVNAGDIMILVRNRTQFADEMVRRLKARNIAVAGSDRMELGEQLAVMDLIAAARFALLPEDDLNTATVLKGPFVGLDEDALFELAWNRGDHSLWQVLCQRAAKSTACIILREMLGRADFMPPFEFFTTLLGAHRGREKLIARLGQEANDPIDEFLNQALNFEQNHVASLEEFLGWIDAAQTQIKRDMETGNDKVRVMTVHGSKGLEANIVILPDTCSAPDGRKSDNVLWGHDKTIPLWPGTRDQENQLCRDIRQNIKQGGLEEYRRLLYVAMTRARDRLYIAGWENKQPNKDTGHGRDDGSWYELVKPALESVDCIDIPDDIRRFETPQSDEPESGDDTVVQVLPLPVSQCPDWLHEPPKGEPEPALPLAPSAPDGEEPAVLSPFDGNDTARFRRGNLIHRLLQSLPDLAPSQRPQAARRWLKATASDLTPETREEIATETLNIVQHPDFADIFGPDSLPEVAIAGTIETAHGPRTIAGQVDRLCIGKSTITVVDYKTNRPPPKHQKDIPAVYFRQMALYKAALVHIYPEHHIRCMLVWTHTPSVMILDIEKLQTAAP